MDKSIGKRMVLVTGGAGGIGKSISLQFAKHEWDVICHYCSSGQKARTLKDEITQQFESECYLIRSDFRLQQDLEEFIRKIEDFHVHALINNAGSYVAQQHFSQLGFREMIETFSVNVFAPIQITSYLFSRMVQNQWGRIVNISSIAAKYGGSPYSLHYGCSKRAIEGLTKTLAREGAQYNVLVNTVRPGVIDTTAHQRYPHKDMQKRVEMIPLKKMGQPENIAEMVYYLGSDKNQYITNETITLAGGE